MFHDEKTNAEAQKSDAHDISVSPEAFSMNFERVSENFNEVRYNFNEIECCEVGVKYGKSEVEGCIIKTIILFCGDCAVQARYCALRLHLNLD